MMEVIDTTAPISDEELQSAIERMAALVAGLDGAPYHCACKRYYKLGITDELRQVLATVRRAIRERTGTEPVSDTTRFTFLEVD